MAKNELKIDPNLLILMFKSSFKTETSAASIQMKYAIEAFLMKSFHNLKKNVENDISALYFDNLTTENLYEVYNKETSKLQQLSSQSELVDSPFAQINGRSSKDVVDFVVLLENIIKIIDGDVETLKELFGDGPGIFILSLVNKCIINQDIEVYLTLLEKISTAIIIETNDVIKVPKYACPLEDWESIKVENLSNSLNSQEKSQWMIIQLAFLFCCKRFNNMLLQVPQKDVKRVNRALDDFFESSINRFLPVEQKLMPSQIGMKEITQSLFESSFFSDIAKQIFYQIVPQTQAIWSPETILGVIVGLSLNNSNLVRTNLLHLLGESQNRIVSGLYGILAKDPNLEKDIRSISKLLKIKPDLSLSLIDIMWKEPDRDKYNPLMNICGDYCSSSNIVSAIVAIFKGDLSWVRILSERFEVDQHMLSVILACAWKRYDLLRNSFDELSKKLRINNEKAVETILEIAWGNEDKIITDLENHKDFEINDKWVVWNTLKLDRIGRKMRKPHNRFEIPDWSYSCRTLYYKLESVLGLQNPQPGKEEGKEVKENELNDYIKLIVHSVWGSTEDIETILYHIDCKIATSKGMISDIWSKYPTFKESILKKSLKKIFTSASETISKINSNLESKLKELHDQLNALATNKIVQISPSSQKEASILKALKDYKKQLAFKIGWTANVVGEKEYCQKYLNWVTWENSTNTPVKVCIPCAEFCHAGHQLEAPKIQELRIVCSCGSRQFPYCPVNDKENPLENIVAYGQLPPASCSLLKSNTRKLIEKKCNFKIHKRLKLADEIEVDISKEQSQHTISRPAQGKNSKSSFVSKLEEPDDQEQFENSSSKYKISSEENSLAEEESEENKESSSQYQEENEGGEENEVKQAEENNNEAVNDNIYYDDTELKEKFEEDLVNYKPEDFIVDLILALKFNTTNSKEKCPIIYNNKYFIFDESLWRYAHLYEHIILLAYGFCRPGLVDLLSK